MRRVLLLLIVLAALPASADRLLPIEEAQPGLPSDTMLVPGGGGALVVWIEADGAVYATVLASNGSPVAQRVAIATGTGNHQLAGAFNGVDYLVAWRNGTSVRARRLSSTGVLLDAADILVTTRALNGMPRMASDGFNWLLITSVGSRTYGAPCGTVRISVWRISPAGIVIDPTDGVPLLPNTSRDQLDPDVAWDGERYSVAWQNYCLSFKSTTPATAIAAGSLTADLSRFESTVLTPETTKVDSVRPLVSANSGNTLVAWTDGDAPSVLPIEYRLVGSSFARGTVRQRAVGPRPKNASITGALFAIGSTPSGMFLVYWAGQAFTQTTVSTAGSATNRTLDGVTNVSREVVAWGERLWILDPELDRATGAVRLFIHELE